jgi:hypothetical protein
MTFGRTVRRLQNASLSRKCCHAKQWCERRAEARMAMNNLYGDLRCRPTRIGFLVPTTNYDAVRSAMQICTCLWGGRYNPIIPVDENVPVVWRDPIADKLDGIHLAKGYVDFFEPDIFAESEPGLAQKIGLQPTEIDFGLSRIVPLAAFSEELIAAPAFRSASASWTFTERCTKRSSGSCPSTVIRLLSWKATASMTASSMLHSGRSGKRRSSRPEAGLRRNPWRGGVAGER